MLTGTRWCGPGDVATHLYDLGTQTETDSCCRDHDLCHDVMLPNTCKHGLCNTSPFTRCHCDCDANFKNCLIAVGNSASQAVGLMFFNVGAMTCFRADHRNGEWSFFPSGSFKNSTRETTGRQLDISRTIKHNMFNHIMSSVSSMVKSLATHSPSSQSAFGRR